jgi:hypothetical protein
VGSEAPAERTKRLFYFNIMIVQKQFKGKVRGRDNKYPFYELKVGSCLIIDPTPNIIKFRKMVSSALYHWKEYNGYKWETAVRIENDKISVYRIS